MFAVALRAWCGQAMPLSMQLWLETLPLSSTHILTSRLYPYPSYSMGTLLGETQFQLQSTFGFRPGESLLRHGSFSVRSEKSAAVSGIILWELNGCCFPSRLSTFDCSTRNHVQLRCRAISYMCHTCVIHVPSYCLPCYQIGLFALK
jgi:hypothetical protein